jgi:head-tail adaptor
MGYSAGFLYTRVTIRNKVAPTGNDFGTATKYEDVCCVWANVTWSKGVKALHEGALDAYDTVLIRMRWNNIVSRDSLIVHDGTTYQIISFHVDRRENTIQITAQEIVQ